MNPANPEADAQADVTRGYDRITRFPRLVGPNINRRTEDNIVQAGLDVVRFGDGASGGEIVARPDGL